MISKFIFIAGLLVCLTIASVAQDEAKAAARNEVDEGVQAFRQAHYDDAIAHFEQAVAFDPDLVVAQDVSGSNLFAGVSARTRYSGQCGAGDESAGTVFRSIAQQSF